MFCLPVRIGNETLPQCLDVFIFVQLIVLFIQHIVTLPKYGLGAFDNRRL